jgi:hypothetical protein
MKDLVKQQPREKPTETESRLDEAIEESFPASDPPATTPMTVGGPERPSKTPRDRKPKGSEREAKLRSGRRSSVATPAC